VSVRYTQHKIHHVHVFVHCLECADKPGQMTRELFNTTSSSGLFRPLDTRSKRQLASCRDPLGSLTNWAIPNPARDC
jgi:hypothetical protein